MSANTLQHWRGPAAAVVAAVLGAAIGMAYPALAAKPIPDSFADLAERLLPAVVNIATTQATKAQKGKGPEAPQFPPGSPLEEFFKDFMERGQPQDRPRRGNTSLGSGFIVDPAGYIVTNNHVIAEADEITVNLHDDTNLKAKLIGRDIKTDLALLKVETDKPLVAVKWGNSDQTRVGDWIVAIGNPFGLGGSVTAGILSARARDINSGPYDDFLQTDASINRGNSGGPMFNISGEVIGVNTAIYSPSGGSVGIGFAIPSTVAKPVIDQLKQYGKTRRGWLGVRIQQVSDEIAESLGLDKPRGAMIASVSPGGPAEKAKIEAGDIVLKFDNKDIPEMRRLPRVVAETPIDKKVPIAVWRRGKELKLEVTVGELDETETASLQPTPPKGGEPKKGGDVTLGLSLSKLTSELREKFDIDQGTEGVVVTDVTADSPAGQKGVKAGDVIVEVVVPNLGPVKVKDAKDVVDGVGKAKAAGRKSVVMMIDRGGDIRFVALRLDG